MFFFEILKYFVDGSSNFLKKKTWSIALHHGAPEVLKMYLWQKETESLFHPVLEYLDN